MNVLFITIDRSLTLPAENAPQNSLAREIAIGKRLDKYFIIAMGQDHHMRAGRRISENTVVYPIAAKGIISFLIQAFRTGKQICEQTPVDVISTQDPLLTGLVGLRLKHLFNIPVNMQYHGDYLDNRYWLKERKLHLILNRLGKYNLRNADSILVENPCLQDKIAHGLLIPNQKISFLSCGLGIDIDHFRNRNGNQIRMKYVSDPEQKIVLFVGRLCKQKNIPLLLHAACQIVPMYPKIIFLIIGDGPERKSLMRLRSRLGISEQVHFIGNVPYADIPDFFAASDIVVLPSFYEGWPRVVMETIVSGKPIVTTDGEFLKHDPFVKDYCQIVPTYDAARWAQVIVEVLQKGAESGERERSLKEAQYKFTQDLAIERFIDAWDKTIKPLHDPT